MKVNYYFRDNLYRLTQDAKLIADAAFAKGNLEAANILRMTELSLSDLLNKCELNEDCDYE